jgi:hypothetical protein
MKPPAADKTEKASILTWDPIKILAGFINLTDLSI